jgi:hypothetical protein
MNDTIDHIYRHGTNWQKPLLWLRINLGYMSSEIELVTTAGDDVTGLEQAVGQLEEALAAFARSEMGLFKEACTSDRSPYMSAILGMKRPLLTMQNMLTSGVDALKQEFKCSTEAPLSTRSLPVCRRCIEEISKAHDQVRGAIHDLSKNIDANVA